MRPRHIHALRDHLERALATAHALDSEPGADDVAGRFMDDVLLDAADAVARDDRLITLVVGAGASMEAELPSWTELIRSVLIGVADDELSDVARSAWIETIEREGPLAAASIAKALCASERGFVDLVRSSLYGTRGPAGFVPQSLTSQVAWMKAQLRDRVTVATVNYDGLIEEALRERGVSARSYVRWRTELPGEAAVYHLHGRLMPKYPTTGRVVLAEDDYAEIQDATSWQDRFMRRALRETQCIFVGLSMTDPNLIRWLYRYAADVPEGSRHIALFVRQANPDLGQELRSQLERATRERWHRCGIRTLWADFYAESAQFLHEIALLRTEPAAQRFPDRAAERLDVVHEWFRSSPADFRAQQQQLSGYLERLLGHVVTIAASAGVDLSAERLGIGFWVVDHAGGSISCWGTSDRHLKDSRSIVGVRLVLESPWIAVQAVTRGVVVEDDPAVFASRWRLVRGIPIIVERGDGSCRSIVGAATLTSMTRGADSLLHHAPRGLLGAIDRFLGDSLAVFFETRP